MLRLLSAILAITSIISATPLSIQRRDPPLDDSITYCSSVDRGDDQEYYIPCTKTSNPLSEVLTWLPYNGGGTFGRFAAHYECYVETGLGYDMTPFPVNYSPTDRITEIDTSLLTRHQVLSHAG